MREVQSSTILDVPMSKDADRRTRYLGFATLLFGLFTYVADHGSVIIALPSIANHFGSDLPTTQWVMIGYVLAISVTLLPMGRLADLIGRKTVYVGGFAVFILTGLLAGLAPSIPTLIAANTLHGVGAGMTQGTSMAMVVASFPSAQRGRVLGIYMGVVGVGSVFGPAAAGVVVGLFGWQWVFFGGSLLALIAMVCTVLFVNSRDGPIGSTAGLKFDWAGAALSCGALLAFLQAMTWAPRWAMANPTSCSRSPRAAGLAIAFIYWELRTPSPLMDLRNFRDRVFRTGIASGFIHFVGTTSAWFLMPFYLQVVLGFTPGEVGLIAALSYVAMTVMGPVSGQLSDRLGRRYFTVGGLLTSAAGILTLSTLGPTSHVGIAIAGMVMQSLGMGAVHPAEQRCGAWRGVRQSACGGLRAAEPCTKFGERHWRCDRDGCGDDDHGVDGLPAEPGRGDRRRLCRTAGSVRLGTAKRLLADGGRAGFRGVGDAPRRCSRCRREACRCWRCRTKRSRFQLSVTAGPLL